MLAATVVDAIVLVAVCLSKLCGSCVSGFVMTVCNAISKQF
jgi:hypothetical protein